MPELPDLEVMKSYLDSTALYKEIDAVEVADSIVLEDITTSGLKERLVGQSFDSIRRYGKYLFVSLSGAGVLVLHFGMTGGLQYYKIESHQPDYELIRFAFKNGYRLAYTMPRKLGHVTVTEDPDQFIQKKDLGPDVFADDFNLETFKKLLDGRRGMIKPALMDQSLMAGIGNVYSDEILYQARVHPRKEVGELQPDTIQHLFECMQDVLHMAIEHDADPETFPANTLTPLRGEEGADCPRCGGEIRRIEVSGRGAYYCPKCQEE